MKMMNLLLPGFDCLPSANAVYHGPNYGPTFGGHLDPSYVSTYGGSGPDLCTDLHLHKHVIHYDVEIDFLMMMMVRCGG